MTSTPNITGASLPGGYVGDLIARANQSGGYEIVTSGAVTVDLFHTALSVTSTVAFTLADGTYEGQRKRFTCTTAATSPVGTLTIATPHGSEPAAHIFHAVGQVLELVWTRAGAWKATKKIRAGTKTAVLATTVLTSYDMALLYDCTADGTKSSTGTMAIPDGLVAGETCYVGQSAGINTPIGSIDFNGLTLASAAVTHLQAIGAATDTVTLVWTGAAWLVVANSGITVA